MVYLSIYIEAYGESVVSDKNAYYHPCLNHVTRITSCFNHVTSTRQLATYDLWSNRSPGLPYDKSIVCLMNNTWQ